MISEEMKTRLGELRDAVAEVQAAHYEKGWDDGQPVTIAEYESPEFQEHYRAVRERVSQSLGAFNIKFAALLNQIESEGDGR